VGGHRDHRDDGVRARGPRRALGPVGGRGGLLLDEVHEGAGAQLGVVERVERAQAHGEVQPLQRRGAIAGQGVREAARVDALGVAGAHLDGAVEPRAPAVRVAREPERPAHGEVHEGVQRVQLDAALGAAAGRGDGAGHVLGVAQEGRLEVDEGERRVRPREARVLRDGAIEQGRRRGVVGAVEPVQVLQAQVVGGPGVEAVGRREARQPGLVHGDPQLQRRERAGADVGAHPVHVVQRGGEALGPHDAAIARVHQLGRGRQAPPVQFEGAQQQVAHAEQPPDVQRVDVRGPQAERGAARRHEQPAQAREFRYQLVGQGLGDGAVGARVADQAEGQHRERRPRGGGRGWRSGDGMRRDPRLGDEAEAAPVDRADVALGRAVVAQRLARGLHAARHRGVRHHAALPHLLDELVAGHQPVAVLHEQREDLRLHGPHEPGLAQLPGAGVQFERPEAEQHGPSIRPAPPTAAKLHDFSTEPASGAGWRRVQHAPWPARLPATHTGASS